MNNPFLLTGAGRLEHWKTFRKSVLAQPEDERLAAVAHYWSLAPLLTIAYNCDAPATWPTIWEMVQAGDWCRNSVALGIDGTLRLIGFDPTRLTVGLMLDQSKSVMAMVTSVDNATLLNYDWGLLTPYPSLTNPRWLRRYRWTGRGYSDI